VRREVQLQALVVAEVGQPDMGDMDDAPPSMIGSAVLTLPRILRRRNTSFLLLRVFFTFNFRRGEEHHAEQKPTLLSHDFSVIM
jgi:hypothetical protein